MKPKDEVINQAKANLAKVEEARKKKGKLPISQDEYEELVFLATGNKVEVAPIEPYNSDRSFFHLKNAPCHLSYSGGTLDGVFSHPDYAPYYQFVSDEGQEIYFQGGEEFTGTKYYKDYEMTKLYLVARVGTTLDMAIANYSLTSACL